MSSLQKKLILFSLFTLRFFIRNKRHKRHGTFFEREGNSLKRTYVEGGGGGRRRGVTCKTNRKEQGEGGERSQKLEVSSELTF